MFVLGFGVDVLARVLSKLLDHGIRFVVIGDTVVQLALKQRVLGGDVDLFVIEPSVVVDEDRFIKLAEDEGWLYSSTDAGTPKIIARYGDREVPLEFYENIFDVYVPLEIIERAGSISIGGVRIRLIKPEEYLVLKARQGVDLDKVSQYIKRLGRKVDRKLVEKTIKLFPLDEQKLIENRLRSAGLRI